MKGNAEIIKRLNELLTMELTAHDVYFLHSRMYEDWGMVKLFERFNHEMQDENLHASKLMNRILFLEGTPEVLARDKMPLKTKVDEMLTQSLDYEMVVAEHIRGTVELCEKEKDYVTRDLLLFLLQETEEDHINWIETQLNLIKEIGMPRYIQTMSEGNN